MDYYNGNQNMKVLDFSSGNPEHKRFGVITRLDGNLCKIILEPDEALAQAMKNSAPSKVFWIDIESDFLLHLLKIKGPVAGFFLHYNSNLISYTQGRKCNGYYHW